MTRLKPSFVLRLLIAGLCWVANPVTPVVGAQPPAASTGSASLPSGVERVTSVEGITEYRLANGLKVLLFPDPTKETITVNVTYLVGSSHENYGETGMAHLLEHLVAERNDLDRSHQLLRDLCRHRRQSRVGARSRVRSHGELFYCEEGPR